MPKREVKTLLQSTVSYVSQQLSATISHHLNNDDCGTCANPFDGELCPTMKKIKEDLNLPEEVLACIFQEVYSSSTDVAVLYLYCHLLECQNLSITSFEFSICEHFELTNQIRFLSKYGQHVDSGVEIYCAENTAPWDTLFSGLRNLKTLRLWNAKLSDELLEAIGKYCHHIERIENLGLISVTDNLTPASFQKLCFQDYPECKVKNSCCDSLEMVEFLQPSADELVQLQELYQSPTELLKPLHEITTVLLQNLSNLKSLSREFLFDYYLQSQEHVCPKNSLEQVTIFLPNPRFFTAVNNFCPKIKSLHVNSDNSVIFADIYKVFPFIEHLIFFGCTSHNQSIYEVVILKSTWSNLIHLNLFATTAVIELSDFAEHLPALEVLQLVMFNGIKWNGKKYFQRLTSVLLGGKFDSSEMTFVSSFAKTVVSVVLETNKLHNTTTHFDKNNCKPFQTTFLPKLKLLSIDPFHYDFEFLTGVISTCPSLSCVSLAKLNDLEEKQLQQFVDQNNYDCNILVSRVFFYGYDP